MSYLLVEIEKCAEVCLKTLIPTALSHIWPTILLQADSVKNKRIYFLLANCKVLIIAQGI